VRGSKKSDHNRVSPFPEANPKKQDEVVGGWVVKRLVLGDNRRSQRSLEGGGREILEVKSKRKEEKRDGE